MGDRDRIAGPSPEAAFDREADLYAAPGDRVLLLECRLEQLLSSLAEARAEADRARMHLAEASAREAELARRHARVQEELADSREEVGGLHRRLERSEALRAEMEGRLFEVGSPDVEELVRLRREASGTREERDAHQQTMAHLRARIDELVASREVLFTRIVEWQRLVRQGDPEALDLAEFIAALRRDILELEHQNYLGERREAELRRRLLEADGPWALPAVPAEADAPEPGTEAPDPDRVGAGDEVDAPDPAGAGAEREIDALESWAATSEAEADAQDSEGAGPQGATDAPDAEEAGAEGGIRPPTAEAARPGADAPEPEAANSGTETDALEAEAVRPASEIAVTAPPPTDDATTFRSSAREGGRARDLIAELAAADDPQRRIDLLLRLGRCGEEEAFYAVRPSASATEPGERAAAYQALGRLLERDPSRLEPYIRWGVADSDARVRRRVILAAATARGLALRPLLEPLRADPDPQVRRVVNEVLRRRPADVPAREPDPGTEPASRRPIHRASGVAS